MYEIGVSTLADKLPSLFNLGKVVDAILPGPAPVWMYDVGVVGIEISKWFSNSAPWGIAFVVIPAVWQMSGFTMAMYLGGLRSVPDDLREAARMDGASEVQIYRHIILPMLRPVTLSAVIVLGHISLKIFDLVYVIGMGDLSLDVPSVYMWRTIFDATNYARGAAIGILMLIMIAVLIVPYLIYSMRSETEL
jgi:glucose/mannose transport system permease protein